MKLFSIEGLKDVLLSSDDCARTHTLRSVAKGRPVASLPRRVHAHGSLLACDSTAHACAHIGTSAVLLPLLTNYHVCIRITCRKSRNRIPTRRYKQEMEHAMAAASPEPPNYERMEVRACMGVDGWGLTVETTSHTGTRAERFLHGRVP